MVAQLHLNVTLYILCLSCHYFHDTLMIFLTVSFFILHAPQVFSFVVAYSFSNKIYMFFSSLHLSTYTQFAHWVFLLHFIL